MANTTNHVGKSAGRRITLQTVKQIATVVARYKCSETTACRKLGINEYSWRTAKYRNTSNEWVDALAHAKEIAEAAHVDNICQAAEGKGPHERAEWRASAWWLEHFSPEKFGDQRNVAQAPTVTVNMLIIEDVLAKLTRQTEPKAIEAPKEP